VPSLPWADGIQLGREQLIPHNYHVPKGTSGFWQGDSGSPTVKAVREITRTEDLPVM